ncbi:hypothetical protein GY26_08515 [Gammaproteobacteria bacterium MFB021]|nr:hypothetical protein GY26_08515 [Gammaproteobacteria bacterium MFB021]
MPALTIGAGIGLDSLHAGTIGEMNGRNCLLNGEFPAIACHVPVEFIVHFKETDLAIGAITQNETMGPRSNIDIRSPHIETYIVAFSNLSGLHRFTIQSRRDDIEPYAMNDTAYTIDHGKVSIETMTNMVTIRQHIERLCNNHVPRRLNDDIARETGDSLYRIRIQGGAGTHERHGQ